MSAGAQPFSICVTNGKELFCSSGGFLPRCPKLLFVLHKIQPQLSPSPAPLAQELSELDLADTLLEHSRERQPEAAEDEDLDAVRQGFEQSLAGQGQFASEFFHEFEEKHHPSEPRI